MPNRIIKFFSLFSIFLTKNAMSPAVKPTAPEIVDIKRPERPNFFDDERLHLYYEIPTEADRQMVLAFIYEHYLPHIAYQQ